MSSISKVALVVIAAIVVLRAGELRAEDAGTVAVANGQAEVGRSGAFQAAQAGMVVQLGDELRTGGDGRLRVVLRDDSVLNLGENTTLVIDQQVFRPEEGRFNSLLRLIRGKVRSAVGAYYQQSGAVYEVQTATAVAGVRGTTFLVEYDPATEVTGVVGIRGRVGVRNLSESLKETVYVTAKEVTTVGPNRPPTSPKVLDENLYRQRLEGMELVGRQGLGVLVTGAAVQSGSAVAPPESAPPSTSQPATLGDYRDASDVVGQPLPVIENNRGRLGVPF